jgi:hypothetical protein
MNIFVTEQGAKKILEKLEEISGGYTYSGVCSLQLCFPLKAGGELRFCITDDSPKGTISIDLYDGALPPGITGPASYTGLK